MTWEEAAILDNMHRGFARYDKYVAELEAQVAELQHQLAATQNKLAQASIQLTKSQAHAKGLSLQVSLLAAELRKDDKGNHLLENTEFVWPSGSSFEGKPMSKAGALYLKEVERYLSECGVNKTDCNKYYV